MHGLIIRMYWLSFGATVRAYSQFTELTVYRGSVLRGYIE